MHGSDHMKGSCYSFNPLCGQSMCFGSLVAVF